ncbi:MAG TPA: caspase family protein [Blastocatellia bacterium]|nr:caspase family protein [Blastocatellia bacterium]
MNHWVMRTMLQILAATTAAILFLPNTAWPQGTTEPKLRIGKFKQGSAVRSLAISPDGKLLASTRSDDSIQLWDLSTGSYLRSLTGHNGYITNIVFSPDGKMIAGGSTNRTVAFWDVNSGSFTRSFQGHTQSVYSVAFSPDGKTLASASGDYTAKLWEVKTGALIRTFTGHATTVESVAFSPDGKMLATGSDDKTAMVWDVNTGEFVRSFRGHKDWIRCVAISPDGKLLATGSNDRTVKFWEIETGAPISSLGNFAGTGYRPLAFSPDGQTIAMASFNNTVQLWEVAGGQLVYSMKDHDKTVNSVAISPDGKLLASSSGDGAIKIWSTGDGKLRASLVYFEDGNWIAYTPENFYVSSKAIGLHIAWYPGADEREDPELMRRFNQPELVVAQLRGTKVAGGNPNVSSPRPATGLVKIPIKDTKAPRIVITSPAVTRGVGTKSNAGRMTVMGQAFDDSGVAKVTVKGATARLDIHGNFSAEVPLEAGPNLITVVALDVHANQATESFVIQVGAPGEVPATTTVAAATTVGRYHALLIAIQEYDHKSVNSLDYPLSDAQRIQRELTSRYSFEPQNVTTLKNPDRRTIFNTLDQMTAKLAPEDNLLIFYAGHGVWDEQRKQGYWLPRDAVQDRRADWISNSDLRDAIRGIKARHILLISDACFAGGIFLAREAFTATSSAAAELEKLPSRTAMTSGALTTVPDRSVFVEYLLKRLADNTDERLPALELFGKLRLPVINNSPTQKDGMRPTPRYGTIFEVGDEGGDFIFVRRR